MKRKAFGLLVILLCLSWGFSTALLAQDTEVDDRLIYLREGPYQLLDTPEIIAEVDKARALAGDALNLVTNELGQCNDFDDTYSTHRSSKWTDMRAVPTQVFDNVYYVGGKDVGGWVIDTGDGLIMLDSYWGGARADGYNDILKPNFAALDLDPAKVKYILVTHGGPDHIGALHPWLVDYPNVEIIYNQPLSDPYTFRGQKVDIPTKVMGDGAELTLGDTTIKMILTPRTPTGGGFSYLIPVWVNGKRHMWATFGNTGQPTSIEDKALWLESIVKFQKYVRRYRADIALSSHPFVDASLDYMEMIRECNDKPGHHKKGWKNKKCRKNPLVIGRKDVGRYFEIFEKCANVATMRQASGLSINGLSCGMGYMLDSATGLCEPFSCDDGFEVHPKNNVCVAKCSPGVPRDRMTGECAE